jgi:hypothetical protein
MGRWKPVNSTGLKTCTLVWVGQSLAQNFPDEGEQSNMARPFNGIRQAALVLGTGTSLPASPDLTVFMDKAAQQVGIFVINHQTFIGAKLAGTRPVEARPALV